MWMAEWNNLWLQIMAWSNYQKYGILAQGNSCSGNNFKCFKFYTSVVGDTKSFFGNDYITKSVLACPSLLAIQPLKRFINLVLVSVASFLSTFFSLQYLTCKMLWFSKPSAPSNKLLDLRINRWLYSSHLDLDKSVQSQKSQHFYSWSA